MRDSWDAQPEWARQALWPAALVIYAVTAAVALHSTFAGYDFRPVWLAGNAFVHGQDPYSVSSDLPFVYPPGALLLAGPLGLLPFGVARGAYYLFQVAALPVGMSLCLRMVGRPVVSAYGAGALAVLALTNAASSTLVLHNWTTFAFLGEIAFLMLATRGRWTWSGVALGASLAIKPVAVLLILIPLMHRQRRAAAVAVGVALALCLAPTPFITGDAWRTAIRRLTIGGDFSPYNASLANLGDRLHVAEPLVLTVRVLVVAVAVVATAFFLRRDEVVAAAGVLVVATLLASSLSWGHYGLLLVPLAAELVRPRSRMRRPLVATGLTLLAFGPPILAAQYGAAAYRVALVQTVALTLTLIGLAALSLSRRTVRGAAG